MAKDGSLIVYPAEDGSIVVWNVPERRVQCRLEVPFDLRVEALALSPNNELLGVATGGASPQIWSLRTRLPAVPPLAGHLLGVCKLRFSGDGRTLVTYSEDMTARLWNVATGREVMSGLPINQIQLWHPALQILSVDETAAIEPEGEGRWRRVPLPALAEIDEAERQRVTAERMVASVAIECWLLLAPIPFEPGQPGTVALDVEQLPNESQLRPRAGQRLRVNDRELVWRAVASKHGVLDLDTVGSSHEYAVAYAVCYLHTDAPKRGVVLRMGSDDQAILYLNGRQIFRSAAARTFAFDQNVVGNIELEAGWNVLVFKVVNETREWRGAIRVTDAKGEPVNGVSFGLSPD
jgi:hypothetical protein